MAYSTQTLAEGCFGKIYKEKYNDTWAALKRVPVGLINKDELERECKVYGNAPHPNVVNLLGDPWIKDAKWNIPLEFIFGEDLETTIFKSQSSKIQLTPAVRATIITGMCEGLLHLHSKDIVHQDLKPDNIIVEHQTHRAVIIDLGLAKFSKNGLSSAANMGNEAYSAPEILRTRGVRDKRSDVWAMGKVIAELCARIRLPTQSLSADKIQETLKDHPYRIPVSKMVETKPSDRASMDGVFLDIKRAASASKNLLCIEAVLKDQSETEVNAEVNPFQWTMVLHEKCVMTHYSKNIEDNIQTSKITVSVSNPTQSSMNARESHPQNGVIHRQSKDQVEVDFHSCTCESKLVKRCSNTNDNDSADSYRSHYHSMAYSTQTLAEGCFGKVYKEKYGDKWAALKRVPVGLINRLDLERECKVYDNARHPNVVKLLGDPCIKDSKWNIPLEFIFGEDLETTIFKSQSSKIQLTPAVRATIITGMCEGLLHLHSKDIVHQDLKPDNIMVEHQTYRAVIIDLGLAKFSKNGLSSAVNLGNEAYSAPEILRTRGVRDKRSDVWAMGKVIAELCARIRLPTQSVSPSKIQETLKDHPYRIPVSRMVETNPSSRASMAGVISDIRRAASGSKTDIKPRDVTVTQANEIRGNQRWALQAPVTSRMEVGKPSVGNYRASMDKPKDFTVTQANEISQRRSPQPPTLQTVIRKPPVVNYRQDPPQMREMEKAVVSFNRVDLSSHMSGMSLSPFPFPILDSGKFIHQSYTEEEGSVQHKEIITSGGKITKYESYEYSFKHS
ncbi:chromosomal serine/threonine-protein kinase JIL-1-like [Triplophysa dalaica]|uniref:chromosomal serine/threonine-protein kinase JIL-1-like n=1 Tax=Triplophysa dalaica TaxID=1582913 RepID=UPI0024E01EF8|nr:chromosomal serine/threonine-protein kinase JIL-1-like [Triplophysa dalaica]